MPTPAQLEAQNNYAAILQEINMRVDAINHCTLGLSGLLPPFVVEFSYLEIRMICELVALGCLVAHGDLRQSSALRKQWSADEIMKQLENLHPQFYPYAIVQTKTATGYHIHRLDPQPLPKVDFLRLYGRLGDVLHRGSLKNLMKPNIPHQTQFPVVMAKLQKLVDMLSNHAIVMRSGKEMFLAMLKNADDNFRPQVAIAESPEPIDYNSPEFMKYPLVQS
ncbi:MAG: hypothetical protein ACLPIG_14395 [Methylocella sp.]